MGDGEAEGPAAAGGDSPPTPVAGRAGNWRDLARTVALVTLGFAGGLIAAPWLRGGDRGGSGGASGAGADVDETRPAPLTASERQQAAKLLLAASSLARVANPGA